MALARGSARALLAASIVAALSVAPLARGDTAESWKLDANGTWNSAANWTPAAVPNGAFTATLGSFATPYTVTLDTSPTLSNLTLSASATLQTNTGTTFTTAALTNAGLLNLFSAQTFHVNGAAVNSGTLNVSSNAAGPTTLTITGNLDNSAVLETSVIAEGGTPGGNTINIGGTLTNANGADIVIQGAGDTLNVNALANSGILQIARGATLNITGGGQGLTDIPVSQLLIQGSANVINSGVSTDAFAHLTTIHGTLGLANGQTISDTPNGGTLNVAGLIVFNGLTPTTLIVNGNLTNNGLVQTGQNFGAGGVHNNNITVSGTFTNASGTSVHLMNAGDALNVNALVLNGNVTVEPLTALNITGGGQGITDISVTTTLNLGGAINVINAAVSTNGLAKLASIEGLFNLYSGQNFSVAPTGGTLTVAHSGTLNVSNIATPATLTVNASFSNTGIVETGGFLEGFTLQNNVITVTGTFTNNATGIFRIQDAGDIANVGALVNNGSITIAPSATLNLTAGGLGLTDIPAGSSVALGGAIHVVNGAVSTDALANLTSVEGVLNLYTAQTSSVTPVGGTLTVATTGTVSASNRANPTTLAINGNVSNDGIVETSGFFDGVTLQNNTLNITGTFTNNANGLLKLWATGDTANLGALINNGTIALPAGAVLNISTGALVNNGSITIDAGAVLNIKGGGQGITDIPANSSFQLGGNVNVINASVSTNALAKLTSVEGFMNLYNGQTTTVLPVGGTLTVGSSAFVNISNNATPTTLAISGNFINNGTVSISSISAGFTHQNNVLNVSRTFTNSATGTFTLSQPGDAANVAGLVNLGTLSVNAGTTLTITGGGQGLTDIPSEVFVNIAGTFNVINAAVATSALSHLTSVEGLLLVSHASDFSITPNGGTLALASTATFQISSTTAATITVNGDFLNNGGFSVGGVALNVSGTFSNLGTGSFGIGFPGVATATLNAMINDSTVNLVGKSHLTITGDLVDNGVIAVNSDQSTGATFLVLNGGTLSGTGTVILKGGGANAQIGGAFTQAAGHTITGLGQINAAMTNQGTIIANTNAAQLSITQPNSNTGDYQATGGGILLVSGDLVQDDALTAGILTAGNYLVTTGGTLTLANPALPITTIGPNASIILSGSTSTFTSGGATLDTSLTLNQGSLHILAHRSFTTTSNLTSTGTLLLGGGTFTAPQITLNGGTLGGFGTFAAHVRGGSASHTIAPSVFLPATSSLTLSINSLATNNNTTLAFNLVSPEPGGSGASSNDLLNILDPGGLSLSAGTTIQIANTSTGPASLGYYQAIQYNGGFTGDPHALTLPSVTNNIAYTLDVNHDPGFIDIHRGFLGDANDDGHVDLNDLNIVLNHLGVATTSWTNGNFDGASTIDLNDLNTVLNHLGVSAPGNASIVEAQSLLGTAPVPEPASLAFVVASISACALRRVRRDRIAT